MNLTRRDFLGAMAGAGAACALPTLGASPLKPVGNVGLQLFSIGAYVHANGIEKTFADVAKIGFKGVEFVERFGKSPKEIKKQLDANGLVACGMHVHRLDFGPDRVKATCEANLEMGNSTLICAGLGNFPAPGENLDEFMKKLVDFYNRAAEDAAKFGCKVGLHNHRTDFDLKLKDGTTYFDYFFKNTSKNVLMEQDVGWTLSAGYDPCEQFKKYPHRSRTFHAKENNGWGRPVAQFDAILGQPAKGKDGKPCAPCVDWDKVLAAAEQDGIKWWLVECEHHFESLDAAVKPSFAFLHGKGKC